MPGLVPANHEFRSPASRPPVQQVIYGILAISLLLILIGYSYVALFILIPQCLIALFWHHTYVTKPDNLPKNPPDLERAGCWTIPLGFFSFCAAAAAIIYHYNSEAGSDLRQVAVMNGIFFHLLSFPLQWLWFRYYGFKKLHPMRERDAKRKAQGKAEFLRQFKEEQWTVSKRETMLRAMNEVLKTPEDEWLHPFNLFSYAELKDLYEWLRDKVAADPDPVKAEPYQPINAKQKTFSARPQDINPPPPPPGQSPEELRRVGLKEIERLKAAAMEWRIETIDSEIAKVVRERNRRANTYSPSTVPNEYPLFDPERLEQYMDWLHFRRREIQQRWDSPTQPPPPDPVELARRREVAIKELNRLKRLEWADLDELELERKKAMREYARTTHNSHLMGWNVTPLEYPLLDHERLQQYMDWLDKEAVRIRRGDHNRRNSMNVVLGTTSNYEPVILSNETRQDLYIIGRKQSGKTTMLENIIVQDFNCGAGMASIDPHGDTSERLLHFVPAGMADRTIYWSPSEFVIPVNIMHADTPDDAARIANDIKLIFQRTSEGWGPQMDAVLLNAVFTLLETPGSTFLDIRRLFIDADWRTRTVVPNLKDADLKSFWEYEWPSYERANAARPILTRMTTFLRYPLVRQVLGVSNPPFEIGKELEKGTAMLFNISKGLLNPEVSALFGVVIVSQIQNAIMRRAKIPKAQRRPFYLYVDEFQNFATSAFDEILSEAGKYQIFLTLVNQGLWQLNDQRLKKSVTGNITEFLLFAGLESSDLLALSSKLGEQGIKLAQSLVPKKDAVYRDSNGNVTKFDCRKPLTLPASSFADQIKANSWRYCVETPLASPAPTRESPTTPPGETPQSPPEGSSSNRPSRSPKPN